MQQFAKFWILFFSLAVPAWAQTTFSFGVVPQRSATLTAQYWNPILDYVSGKSGVKLELVTKKSAQEYSEAEARGEFDFVHNNHIFAPSHAAAAYRVIARPAGEPIHSQIVVLDTSPVHSLRELEGKEIGFANKNGFTGYAAPMSALIQAGATVTPVFGGNQEGVMAQLRAGTIPAAGVNSRVMREYATRDHSRAGASICHSKRARLMLSAPLSSRRCDKPRAGSDTRHPVPGQIPSLLLVA